MRYFLSISFFLVIMTSMGFAQKPDFDAELKEIDELLEGAAAYYLDEDKIEANDQVLKIFSEVLLDPSSFEYPMDSLKRISVINSPDGKLRVFTWNLMFDDMTHKCFGFIQYKADKDEILTYPLKDFYVERDSMERKYASYAEWYGAIYYDIIEKSDRKNTVYTLLGWRGNNLLTQQKIVETLEFDRHNLPVFGDNRLRLDRKKMRRAVYTYSIKTQMILRYNSKQDLIVLDHLSPSDPKLIGFFEHYGPDYSYDAFEYDKGKWYFVSDIDPEIAINYERDPSIERMKERKPSTDF